MKAQNYMQAHVQDKTIAINCIRFEYEMPTNGDR